MSECKNGFIPESVLDSQEIEENLFILEPKLKSAALLCRKLENVIEKDGDLQSEGYKAFNLLLNELAAISEIEAELRHIQEFDRKSRKSFKNGKEPIIIGS